MKSQGWITARASLLCPCGCGRPLLQRVQQDITRNRSSQI